MCTDWCRLCGDVYVETALLGFYTKVGDMRTAQKVFDEMSERNVVSWNSMIDGYLRSGDLAMAKALSLFREMPERKLSSWNAMISGYLECGKVGLPWWLGREYSPKVRALGGWFDYGGFCFGGLAGSKILPPSIMADGNGYEQRNEEKDRLKKT
ncbi:tetratricopeptide repeat (TPR)-like superfamily protein [Artemisia annua]|uniref:Tetratricopeptide repeat (TPR)-like superfamily protein n=1 Tax=Artemisia annua TaxID=35608 RepID=A0A2U1M116_ARTAN|nr:tetratricopeptide repeat (TPR)-like superfamily protein [Artemisia annua]